MTDDKVKAALNWIAAGCPVSGLSHAGVVLSLCALQAEMDKLSAEVEQLGTDRHRFIHQRDEQRVLRQTAEAKLTALVEAIRKVRGHWEHRSTVAAHAVRKDRAPRRSGMQMRHADEVVLELDGFLALAHHSAPVGEADDGQDRKFAFRNGQFVNRVSGEPIPKDEPIIIFRARDRHALSVLAHYLDMAQDAHHQQAIRERIAEFQAYREANPERLKEPGITRDITLSAPPTTPTSAPVEDVGGLIKRLRAVVPYQGKSAVAFLCHEAADALEAALSPSLIQPQGEERS